MTQIPAVVLRKQTDASDPAVSAFVAANAGSGKTHVLVQRVIRLLLDGVDPARILCITFTKAAAANMATRVFRDLSAWIALDDAALDAEIGKIGAPAGGAVQRARARRLFAQALETPGGLKVQTIHAFCTRLLHQFPFEAEVSAQFSVLDERAQNELLERATKALLLDATAAPESPLGQAVAAAITFAADVTFRDVLREAIGKREIFAALVDHAGGLDRAIADLSRALGLQPADTLETIDREIVEGPILPSSEWPGVAKVLQESSANDQKRAQSLLAAAALAGAAQIKTYSGVFFTDKGEPRKAVVTGAFAKKHPELADRLNREQARVAALRDKRNAATCRDRTAALMTVALDLIARYRADKNRRGLLDYDDLIEKSLAMLTSVAPGWVHYKLDQGIDHVLIDEAQDTSPKQWEIVTRLVAEFAAGAGARPVKRTIFAVGDEKQSIFSFQGAAPRMFDRMRRELSAGFLAAGLEWRSIRFDHSFRSGPNVLGAVNEVFAATEIAASITTDADGLAPHLSLAGAMPGEVEIWPLIKPAEREEMEAWDAPFDAQPETSPRVTLARKIATTIQHAFETKQSIGISRVPFRYGDVLILVRQRGQLFEAIIRALKDAGVQVAGADRLILTEHIAVVDLMALADALLLPGDDLALATALKSPLFDGDDGESINDDDLFHLAWKRPGTLAEAVAAKRGDKLRFARAAALLERCVAEARQQTPFGFFAWLLGPAGGRRRVLRRLGPEAADALDEFLELALAYERGEAPTLQGFVAWMRAESVEIKRDMEMSRDEVRVMTVHGAKGLEAPVVILADTTTPPAGPRPPRLLAVPAEAAAPGTPDRLVWAGRKDDDPAAVALARQRALDEARNEYRRLLYVAMTRAAEKLIVAGCIGQRTQPQGCWYDLIVEGLRGKDGWSETGDGDDTVYRFLKVAAPAHEPVAERARPAPPPAPPAWLGRDAPADARMLPPLIPSAGDGEATFSGGGEDRDKALERGRLIHRLLQSLPDVPPERREAAARAYLARNGERFDATEHAGFADRVLAILTDPRFAALFAPGSRAEVSIVGRTADGRPISGQIDRLAITPEAVLIADFKTNRPAPCRAAQVPPDYVRQLALYRFVLTRLYPDRPVRAALIWTDVPDVMELSPSDLDLALARVTSA